MCERECVWESVEHPQNETSNNHRSVATRCMAVELATLAHSTIEGSAAAAAAENCVFCVFWMLFFQKLSTLSMIYSLSGCISVEITHVIGLDYVV